MADRRLVSGSSIESPTKKNMINIGNNGNINQTAL